MLADMAFLEAGYFCSAEEYRRDVENRVNESEVRTDEVYALAALLKSTTREAAKVPVRLSAPVDGLVEVVFLDDDLQPEVTFNGAMYDGMLSIVHGRIIDGDTNRGHVIKEAFLKDYFEDQFGDMLAESRSLSLNAH